MVGSLSMMFAIAATAHAAGQEEFITKPACQNLTATNYITAGCEDGANLEAKDGYLTRLLNIFIYLAGFLSVTFLTVGAARYVTSTGDSKRIQQAKNTIIYSLTGLIVVILAQAIVSFAINRLIPSP